MKAAPGGGGGGIESFSELCTVMYLVDEESANRIKTNSYSNIIWS